MFYASLKVDSWEFKECDNSLSKVLSWCLKKVVRVFQRSVKGISIVFQERFIDRFQV